MSGKNLADRFNQISFDLKPGIPTSSMQTLQSVYKIPSVSVVQDQEKVTLKDPNLKDQVQKARRLNNEDAPNCSECGAVMVRNGACYKCNDCGARFGYSTVWLRLLWSLFWQYFFL